MYTTEDEQIGKCFSLNHVNICWFVSSTFIFTYFPSLIIKTHYGELQDSIYCPCTFHGAWQQSCYFCSSFAVISKHLIKCKYHTCLTNSHSTIPETWF